MNECCVCVDVLGNKCLSKRETSKPGKEGEWEKEKDEEERSSNLRLFFKR